jgi:hypothetical protein
MTAPEEGVRITRQPNAPVQSMPTGNVAAPDAGHPRPMAIVASPAAVPSSGDHPSVAAAGRHVESPPIGPLEGDSYASVAVGDGARWPWVSSAISLATLPVAPATSTLGIM